MDTLSDVHISDLAFLTGDAINSIHLGKFQIVLELGSGSISVYSRLAHTDTTGKRTVTEAEGPKVSCPFTEALEKTVSVVSFERPAYLALQFEDDTVLKVDGENSGYEAFLVNSAKGIMVFK